MHYPKNLAALLALSLTSTPALADALGLHLGIGQWLNDPEGKNFNYTLNDLNHKQSTNAFYYAAFEHPVPLLPNVRIQYTNLDHKGNTEFPSIDGGVLVSSHTQLSQTDAIGYYELLDNWISLDVGVGVRRYTGRSRIVIDDVNTNSESADTYLPTLYGDANFDLPFTGFSVGASVLGGSFNSSEFTEFSARVSYMLDNIPSVGGELGFKKSNISRINGLDLDGDYSGPYLTLKAHF
ncbi:TIGR04219 family outer membrane beta-barrel protein [Simiduia aestuariiviva]|uniref:Outer membrane protein n=1 Tax=Simiduia aestuariiviva TaxID=1510459 RepID=A0A839URB2_9GAMM|nr:TIGR04219 family outer membrane beta-barrel protein [Simiduia aestuariiviva]MBB3168078.1 outer membrane protein [Simiduia aestuariiviva]